MAKQNRTGGYGGLQIALSFAFTLAAALGLGYLGGAWLDRRLGAFPWLSTAGVVLGLVGAFRMLLRDLRRSSGAGGSGKGN